jgi:hypothetical protein
MNSTAKDLDSNSPATVAAADKERFSVLSSLTPDIARAMRRYRPRSMRKVPRAIARSTGVNSVRIVRPAITPTLANTIRSVTTLAEPWRLARAPALQTRLTVTESARPLNQLGWALWS